MGLAVRQRQWEAGSFQPGRGNEEAKWQGERQETESAGNIPCHLLTLYSIRTSPLHAELGRAAQPPGCRGNVLSSHLRWFQLCRGEKLQRTWPRASTRGKVGIMDYFAGQQRHTLQILQISPQTKQNKTSRSPLREEKEAGTQWPLFGPRLLCLKDRDTHTQAARDPLSARDEECLSRP